jgi:hypothetical protein
MSPRDCLAECMNEYHHLPRYGEGRVCAHEGCTTILNPYNPLEVCGLHEPEPDNCYNGKPVIVCAYCGEASIGSKKHPVSRTCGHCGRVREEAMPCQQA